MDLLGQGSLDGTALHRVVSLFHQLDESEFQYLTWWAKCRAPAMLRVVKIFFDRLQRRCANHASGLGGEGGEGRWVTLKERVHMASRATQPDQFMAALKDGDAGVFQAALGNPGLTANVVVAVIPSLDGARAEQVAGHRAWAP